MLKGKKIILGITGSIAAYKAAILVRLLVKEGAEVRILMTTLAKEFITPLTLATLSNNPVFTDFFNPENGNWNSHVDLGIWADAFVVAPATANTMAKMAHGVADNLLLTTYLSARCPVFIAPAMDMDMYKHPSTLENISILEKRGATVIKASSGELASGLYGEGRMEEPENIVGVLSAFFSKESFNPDLKKKLKGKKVLLTAGPTYEAIDPIRFIGNHSSGKMGYALAEMLADYGAHVTLVSGPTSQVIDKKNATVIRVSSAKEMHESCLKKFPKVDGAILSAAVADYRPKNYNPQKIKSSKKEFVLELETTPDIAMELGKLKRKDQFLVGFALETEDEKENAQQKLRNKNFDLIVLNSLNDKGAGFGYDTNKISILDKNNNLSNFELKSKKLVALDIIRELAGIL
jgi:phosphopantothenoylcysteine decarboxylase / phosphopantothenate---cysteine ligase